MASWQLYETNAVWVVRDTFLFSFAYKWDHEKKVHVHCLPDFPSYRRDKFSDKALCSEIHGLLDDADIVIAHNGRAFDAKKINSRLAVNGFRRPSPYKLIDTLTEARKIFKFDSNKLDNIGRYLNPKWRKLPTTGAALWQGCYDGDRDSWEKMRRYNKRDVVLLAKVYHRLKGWMPNHPNLNLYTSKSACPTCQSSRTKKRGLSYGKTVVRQRHKCLDCGAQWAGQIIKTQTTVAVSK